MGADHRIEDVDGRRLDYTCENSKFLTNIQMGQPHREGQRHGGSVFQGALAEDDEYSLWLEHVRNKQTGERCYWLMWYRDGRPTIPLSGVLGRDDIPRMAALLASFVP
jgi:hypothetical protein